MKKAKVIKNQNLAVILEQAINKGITYQAIHEKFQLSGIKGFSPGSLSALKYAEPNPKSQKLEQLVTRMLSEQDASNDISNNINTPLTQKNVNSKKLSIFWYSDNFNGNKKNATFASWNQ
jgi:hypothetical protein